MQDVLDSIASKDANSKLIPILEIFISSLKNIIKENGIKLTELFPYQAGNAGKNVVVKNVRLSEKGKNIQDHQAFVYFLFSDDGKRCYLSLNLSHPTDKIEVYRQSIHTTGAETIKMDLQSNRYAKNSATAKFESRDIFSIKYEREIIPDEATLRSDLRRMMELYDRIPSLMGEENKGLKQLYHEPHQPEQIDLIDQFYNYIRSRKFHFSKEFIARFIYSLKSKPFVLLSGISGTGKTKIAQLFAEFMSIAKSSKPREESTDVFEYTLNPYNFKNSRMVIPVALMDWMDMPELEKGIEVQLHFENQSEPALMKTTKRGYTRLGFRKGFYQWLHQHFQVGQPLYMRIVDKGERIYFYQSQPDVDISSVKQWCFLSVRPDWLDHRGLLGYYNPILQKYQVTDMLKIMLRAHKYQDRPFFVILDEMNLAKVEYYFSDFLSCLESRRSSDNGTLKQEGISLHQESEHDVSFIDEDNSIYDVPTELTIPENLYFIGTVNVDETTYMFSPKVLDRAHVLECNEVQFQWYWEDQEKKVGVQVTLSDQAKTAWFTNDGSYHRALYEKWFFHSSAIADTKSKMHLVDQLNQLLRNEGHLFGYRVFDEIFTFLHEMGMDLRWDDNEKFDFAILQKVIPKLHGNRAQMDSLLQQLIRFCLREGYEELPFALEEDDEDYSLFRFPRSVEKMRTMYRQLLRTGYCSFIA